MYEVIYTSTAARPMSVTDLADLLRVAREKNERLGITGMLLYKKESFLQVMEGEKKTVLDLYETIKGDERHRAIVTLASSAIEDGKRHFPDWQMGFHHFGDVFPGEKPEGDMHEGYSEFMNEGFSSDAFTAEPSYARNTLLHFRDTNF